MADMSLIFWSGTIPILSLGCISTITALLVLWNYSRKVKRVPLLIQAYAALVVGDVFMWSNFLPKDIYQISVGHLEDGIWCKISAVWTISCVFAINGLCMCIAYCTYLVCHKVFIPRKYPIVLYWSIASWILGFILSGLYAGYDYLGPYKGLYCCIKRSAYTNFAVLPLFAIFTVSICSMSFWYTRAFQLARTLEDKNRQPNVEASPTSKLQGHKSGVAELEGQRASIRVMKQGIILVISFYVGWFPISFIGLLEYLGVNVPVQCDMFAAWVAKLSVMFNAAFIILSVTTVARKPPRANPRKEDNSSQSSNPSGMTNGFSTLLRLLTFTWRSPHSSSDSHPNRVRRGNGNSNGPFSPSSPRSGTGNPILNDYTEDQLLRFAIRNTKARRIFLLFCVKEFSVESLKFLVAYQHLEDYTKSSDLKDPIVAQTCVALIQDVYRMYLAKDSPREVNISAKTKKAVRESYQTHFKGGVNVSSIDAETAKALSVFQLAYEEVHNLVLNHSWPRFVRSEHYEAFLKQARKAERRRLKEIDEQENKKRDTEVEHDVKTRLFTSLMAFLHKDIQQATDHDLNTDLQSVDDNEEGNSVSLTPTNVSAPAVVQLCLSDLRTYTPSDSPTPPADQSIV